MDLKHTIRVNRLLDIYGSLLTTKQLKVMREYFCLNNSLGEISEKYGISRQAVNYTIKQCLKILEHFEDNLHLIKKFDRVHAIVAKAEKTKDPLIKTITKILEE